MNPELKRNILIEITPQRLLAMPLILGLIFAAAWALEKTEGLITTSEVMFWLLIYLWGTRKAAGAFDSEMANNTWDGQRLSALTAGQIVTGKMFGSTSFVLYGAVISIAVNAGARLDLYTKSLAQPVSQLTIVLAPSEIAWLAGHDLLAGLMGLVIAMFVAVVLMARTRSSKGISVTLCQLFAIGVAGLFADRLGNFGLTSFGRELGQSAPSVATAQWYGVATPVIWFITASLVVYLLWAILGTVRQLRSVLQFRGYRWAWPLFVLFVGAYLAGFDTLYQRAPTFENQAFVLLAVFWFTAVLFTYLAVFTETKSLQGYRSYVSAVRRGRILEVFQHQPFWLISLLIAVIALVANLVFGQAQTGLSREFDKELTAIFQIGSVSGGVKGFLVVASLFLLRDCLLVMALNFTRNRRRADLAALVYLAVLYVIVPLVLHGFNLDRTLAMKFFVPQLGDNLILSVGPVAIEIVVLAALMVWRWQLVRQPLAGDTALA